MTVTTRVLESLESNKSAEEPYFTMSDRKAIKINDATSFYKSAARKSLGFGSDKSTAVVKRDETDWRLNREFVAHMTKTELDICPTHCPNVLYILQVASYICVTA